MIREEFKDVGIDINKLSSTMVLVAVSLTLIPVILIRDFNRIKVRCLKCSFTSVSRDYYYDLQPANCSASFDLFSI
jgi:hypothetical protein